MNWTEDSCKIQSLNETGVRIDLIQSSIFTLAKVENSSSLTTYCLFILNGILFAGACLVFFMCFCDKGSEIVPTKKTLILLYPLTSIMIPQSRPWRLFQALHIVSSQSLLLLLIGGFHFFFPQAGGFQILTISKSYICLCLSQAFSLSSQIAMFSTLKHKNINYLVYTLTLIVLVISYTGIVLLTFKHPESFIYNWVCGFLLFSPAEIIVIQLISSLILSTRSQMMDQVVPYITDQKSYEDFPSNLCLTSVRQLRNDSIGEMIFYKRDENSINMMPLSLRGNNKGKGDERKRFNYQHN